MSSPSQTEIEIGIKSSYDPAGSERAAADLDKLRQQAAETPHPGTGSAPVGQDEEQQRSEALTRQMELETMARKALLAEIERLNVARKAAAQIADTATYQKLTAQYKQAKAALEQLNAQTTISRAAMAGQAQSGLAAGSALTGLATSAREGQINISGMVSQVIALGAALKAGLGPIGWIMIALQGLQAAWDAWQGNKAEDLNAQLEANRQHAESLQRAWEEMRDASRRQQSATLGAAEQEWNRIGAAAEQTAEQTQQTIRATLEQEEETARHLLTLREQSAEAQQRQIETARLAGQISEESAREQLQAIAAATAAAQRAVEEESAARRAAAAQDAAVLAREEAAALREAWEQNQERFRHVLQLELPSDAEIATVEARLKELNESDPAYQTMERQKERLAAQAQAIADALEAAGLSSRAGLEANIATVRKIRAMQREQEKLTAAKQREAAAAEQTAAAQQQAAERTRAHLAALQTVRDAEKRQEAARQQQQTLEETWRQKQSDTLAEQTAWLEQTIAGLAAGSAAAKKWAEQLRAVKLKSVQEELGNIERQYRLTGDYARQDNRTQAQIHAADKKALQARRAALRKLAAAPGTDAATLKAINAKLKETDKQTAGLRNAIAASARAAQAALEGARPQQLKAKNKLMQSALNRASQAYAALAKRAAAAANKGDTKALSRYQEQLRRTALQQERLAGYTGQAAAHHKSTLTSLQAIRQGTAAEARGKTAGRQARERIERSLQTQSRATRKAADEAGKTAKEQAKLTQAAQKQAHRAQQQNPAAKIANLNGEITSLKTAVNQCAENTATLRHAIVGLADAANATAAAAGDAAGTAAAALGGMKKQIETLRKQIARLNAKI